MKNDNYITSTAVPSYASEPIWTMAWFKQELQDRLTNHDDEDYFFESKSFQFPFSNGLTLSIPGISGSSAVKVVFYDITGRTVYAEAFNPSKVGGIGNAPSSMLKLPNLEMLPSGVYFIDIQQAGKSLGTQTLK